MDSKGRVATPRSWKPQAASSSVAARKMKDRGARGGRGAPSLLGDLTPGAPSGGRRPVSEHLRRRVGGRGERMSRMSHDDIDEAAGDDDDFLDGLAADVLLHRRVGKHDGLD